MPKCLSGLGCAAQPKAKNLFNMLSRVVLLSTIHAKNIAPAFFATKLTQLETSSVPVHSLLFTSWLLNLQQLFCETCATNVGDLLVPNSCPGDRVKASSCVVRLRKSTPNSLDLNASNACRSVGRSGMLPPVSAFPSCRMSERRWPLGFWIWKAHRNRFYLEGVSTFCMTTILCAVSLPSIALCAAA